MMSSTQILRALTLTTLLIPGVAFAYLSPEEVLSSDQNAGFYDPPPSPREAEAAQAAQQSSDAERRRLEQEALFQKSSMSSAGSDDALHGAAPETDPASLSTTDQRILERVKAQQMQAEIEARAQVLASQQSLHGGAPLANSGPASIVIAFVMAGAGIWTIWKARRMEKQN